MVIYMTEKVYLENPYLRQLEARIVEKKYDNNKYYLITNKTIFYPNLAGGQPGDKGTINGIEVLEAYEDGDDIIHVLGENIHSDKVKMTIDWNTRFDYMQQHSGQHLLSSVFYKLFNGETIGFYIGKEYVYIDVNIPKISNEEIEKVESFANKIVFSNFSIKTYIVEREDMDKIPVRKNINLNSNIRIVEIDEIDFSPCCGTHVRSTGEIGLIKIRKVEPYKGNIRVEFVCGHRALKDYTWKSSYIRDISNMLSVKDKDVKNKVEKLYKEKENLEKENRKLREKIYKYEAESLFNEGKSYKNVKIIVKKFSNKSIKDIQNISNILRSYENTISLLGVANEGKMQFVIARNGTLDINLKNILNKISKEIDIKGGGSENIVQGSCDKNKLDELFNMFHNEIVKTFEQ